MSTMLAATPREDAVLDAAIAPNGAPATSSTVFLTGATGFLGAQVLAEILRETDWRVICLVRADDSAAAAQRVVDALAATGREGIDTAGRVTALCGDLAEPDFGLAAADFDDLAATVGQIIHCAAEVSWNRSYARLRGSHIDGTVTAIRLACLGPRKALHFVSTLAVCYVPGGPETVDETVDMAPYLDAMPLGYAQAKCVAESLLRQVAARGLSVTILRCGLICGDSVSGVSNHDDLLSRMLRGTVQARIAADVDWALDCVPVDTVAQALRLLAEDVPAGLRVLHQHHDEPRQWREMVLWLRLNGYDVTLVPLDEWLAMVGDRDGGRAPDLHAMQAFFLARPPSLEGRSLTELYLEPNRRRIRATHSRAWFDARGLVTPRLDAHLLDRYLVRYRRTGFLPATAVLPKGESDRPLRASVTKGLRATLHAPTLELGAFEAVPLSGSGVLSELSTVTSARCSGLWRCSIEFRRSTEGPAESLDAVLKLRSTEMDQDAATLAVADLCSPHLATAFRAHLQGLAYRGGGAREIALATGGDDRLTRFMPRLHAVIPPSDEACGGVLEEFLDGVDLIDSADAVEQWRSEHIDAAVHALGQIHAVWLGREAALLRQPWLARGADDLGGMLPLWRALGKFSAPLFAPHLGAHGASTQRALLAQFRHWWPRWRALPRTLVHNDFNPRNLAFRRSGTGPVLCAYDWELATIGPPQSDLAELLCFVLPSAEAPQAAQHWLDLHRRRLEEASGCSIAPAAWHAGFVLALRHYMVSRLPLYAMIDRFKPQLFLARVVGNWASLYRWAETAEGATHS